MAVETMDGVLSDVSVFETDQRYCRETFLAEGAVVKGQVLINGTNAVTQKKPAAAAGTGANAVALNDAASGAKVVCIVRGPAIVNKNGLVYHADATAQQKADADALLVALGILVRE
jgi:hypothetical protein